MSFVCIYIFQGGLKFCLFSEERHSYSMSWCTSSDRNSSSAVTPPPAAPEKPTTACTIVSKRVDAVAARLISRVTAAFFFSLQRFACLNIKTKGDSDDGDSLRFPIDGRQQWSWTSGEWPEGDGNPSKSVDVYAILPGRNVL